MDKIDDFRVKHSFIVSEEEIGDEVVGVNYLYELRPFLITELDRLKIELADELINKKFKYGDYDLTFYIKDHMDILLMLNLINQIKALEASDE